MNHTIHVAQTNTERVYLKWMWFTLALSGIVFVEPAPVDIFSMVMFGGGVFLGYVKFHRNVSFVSCLLWLFLLANLVSLYFAKDTIRGVQYVFVTGYLILFFFFLIGVLNHFRTRGLSMLFSGYVAAAILSAIIGILTYFEIIPFSEKLMTAGRIKALFKDPNVFGPFLVPVALYSFARISSTVRAVKLGWATVFSITSMSVFLSFSRAAWINYILSILLFILLRTVNGTAKEKLKTCLMFLLSLLILTSLFFILFKYTEVGDMFTQRFGLQEYDQDRFSTQKIALESAMTYPLGIGPGQSEIVFQYSTHSLYARILSENGITGFLSFITFVCVTCWRSLKLALRSTPKQQYYMVCTAALIGVVINSLVVDTLHWRHFWFLLAVPWVYEHTEQWGESSFANGKKLG